jgi:V8-like Glu-specific endopeptidase
MRQRGRRTGRCAPDLLARPAALATAAVIAIVAGVALTSPTAQGAAKLAVRLAAAAKALPRRAPSAPPLLVHGRLYNGTPAVGAVFTVGAGGHLGPHFCTASVVASPGGDLVITAAHCVSGAGQARYAFAPGYHNGWAPLGIWIVSDVIVDQAWANSADPNDDVAFLVVKQAGSGRRIQHFTGAERLGTGWSAVQVVQVIGYPDGQPWPITCRGTTRAFGPSQLEFDCGGFTNGTSGGPFLARISPVNGLGTVIGVIGGYEQGGDTPSVSYSPRFGRAVAALYRLAKARS